MVVDDDACIRESIGAFLELTGRLKVDLFASATAALSAIINDAGHYQFVLTDFDMPGMNGIEFCRRVLAFAPGTKVLLVTGDATIDEAQVRGLGFCGLVKKPFPLAELQAAVATAQPGGEKTFSKNTMPLQAV